MTGDRVRHLAEYLIRRACQGLPAGIRDERCREWTAELPAILDDPGIRSRARRSLRALSFAADHARGTRRSSGTSRQRWSGLRKAQVIVAFTTWLLCFGLVAVHIGWYWYLSLVAAGTAGNIVLTIVPAWRQWMAGRSRQHRPLPLRPASPG